MIIPSVVYVLSPITNSKNIQRESVDRSDTDATNFSVTEKRTKKEDYTVKKNHMKRILKHGSINSRCKEISWRSCSILLNVVKTVYSYRELQKVLSNFLEERTGPLSPRRVHLIGYHYLDFCGDNMDEFTKAVNAINSGIRAISRK